MIEPDFLDGEEGFVALRRQLFGVASLVVAAALGLSVAPHADAECTTAEWIDLCSQGGRSAYVPCVCDYMDDAGLSIDIDRPANSPNRPNNDLPGAGRPGGGGGGVVIGGGRGGGGGRR